MTTNIVSPSWSFDIVGQRGSAILTDTLDTEAAHDITEKENSRINEIGLAHNSSPPDVVRIGVVDSFAFSRSSIIEALAGLERGFVLTPFETAIEFILSGAREIDVILYYDHEQTPSCVFGNPGDPRFHEELANVPIIILSDAMTALEPQTVKAALKCGVRGFISTRTFEMKTVSAAIRFVKAGGVFTPVELSLVDEAKPLPGPDESAPSAGLWTPRQMAVLGLLQQGKANKTIAYELGMSESTVKVHIRNIMRKIGATNRTQALYKLQQLSKGRAIDTCARL